MTALLKQEPAPADAVLGRRQGRDTARAILLLLLVGWGALWLARDTVGLVASPARGAGMQESEPIALARCEGSLVEARRQMSHVTENADACRRVAVLELRRAELLALVVYEARYGQNRRQIQQWAPDSIAWRGEFLQGNPGGCVTRAALAARQAVQYEPHPKRRQEALELLARTHAALGDARGEAAALGEAARVAPARAGLWLRLSEACGRARQFKAAEVARFRAQTLIERPWR